MSADRLQDARDAVDATNAAEPGSKDTGNRDLVAATRAQAAATLAVAEELRAIRELAVTDDQGVPVVATQAARSTTRRPRA